MGTLRFEPKLRPPVNETEWKEIAVLLRDAETKAAENHVFYDLGKDEDRANTRKKFLYVAEKEGVNLRVQAVRDQKCLKLLFSGSGARRRQMSATEAKTLLLKTLRDSDNPLARRDILKETGVGAVSWNLRIKELLAEGLVRKVGKGRNARYLIK